MRTVHKIVILCSVVGLCVILLGSRHGRRVTRAHEAASLAIELGITPTALAVAAFGPEDAQVLLERLASAQGLWSDLIVANEASAQAVARLVQSAEESAGDPSNAELRTAYAAAALSAEDAAWRVGAARRELLAVALDGIPADRRAILDRCMSARGHRMEGGFGVLPHETAELDEIEACLIVEARASRLALAPDPRAAERLATLRANPEVTHAEQRILLNQGAIEVLFVQN